MKRITFSILFFFTLFIIQYTAIAQKTDTIYHINGSLLKGDFKSLSYGVAEWKMDGMGTIELEEVQINTISSNKQFEIKMKNELIYYGSFKASNIYRTVYIVLAEGKELVHVEDILEVYPIKSHFWMRTTGNLSLGLNYSKGSEVTTLSFSGNFTYRKKKKMSYYVLSWDGNNTYDRDSLSSTKYDLSLAWQQNLSKGWSAQSILSGSQNYELGTKLRGEFDLMAIKDISYNSWNRLYAGSGLSAIREIPFGDLEAENDVAAIFQLVWRVYKYTRPKIWVDANISYLPYLTDNRSRVVFNLNPQISLIGNDFKFGFNFYYNYDSNPTENAYSTEDYGINLQLTYSIH